MATKPNTYASPAAYFVEVVLDSVLCSRSPNPGENESIQYEDWGM